MVQNSWTSQDIVDLRQHPFYNLFGTQKSNDFISGIQCKKPPAVITGASSGIGYELAQCAAFQSATWSWLQTAHCEMFLKISMQWVARLKHSALICRIWQRWFDWLESSTIALWMNWWHSLGTVGMLFLDQGFAAPEVKDFLFKITPRPGLVVSHAANSVVLQ